MSFINTLINGHEGGLKHEGMTPMQKIALRFVVLGVLYYGLATIEGMMMRVVEITPLPLIDDAHFFAIMTVHPMVGIFGSTYMIVFGAFLFLVPFLMKKPIFSLKMANASWMFIATWHNVTYYVNADYVPVCILHILEISCDVIALHHSP